jgi:hypothetical protein
MSFGYFLEVFLFMLFGQYIHVLIKMREARKKFGRAKYKNAIFFAENWLYLLIDGSLILSFSFMLARVGFGQAIAKMAVTIKPFILFGNDIPGTLWLPLIVYCLYLMAGYAIQSLFYWLIKGGLKKTGIEPVEDERVDGQTS